MGYIRKEMYFPRVVEMWEYMDHRYGAPGIKRSQKRKATPKEIEAHNQRNREKICRWKLRQHFTEDDVFVTLTYAVDKRPENMEACMKDCRRLMDRLRREYKKAGQQMKWIRNIEVGKRNAWHVHLVIKTLPDILSMMAKAWKHGAVLLKPMRAEGEFADLAAYMTKTPRTDKRLIDARYGASQNMPVPEPVTKKYKRWESFEDAEPRLVPKGYYVDKSSVIEGCTKEGWPYRRFQCFPISQPATGKAKKKAVVVKERPRKMVKACDVIEQDPEAMPMLPEESEVNKEGNEEGAADNLDGLNGPEGDRQGV